MSRVDEEYDREAILQEVRRRQEIRDYLRPCAPAPCPPARRIRLVTS